VGPVILEDALTAPRPGTAAIQVIRRIYAPKTITATSAAREKLDDHIANFRKDCQLHDFFVTAQALSRVCRYYDPTFDWHSHIIHGTVSKINKEYGSDATLSLSVNRLVETTGFMNTDTRTDDFQTLLVQYELLCLLQ
jgi:hypothetical protein